MVMAVDLNASRHARMLFVQAMNAAYQHGRELPDPDLAYEDPELWEKIHYDPTVVHALQQRFHQVAGKQWMVAPGGRRPTKVDHAAAQVAEDLLDEITNFRSARREAAKFALRGTAWQFARGSRKLRRFGGEDAPQQWWWTVDRLRPQPKEKFREIPEFGPDGRIQRIRLEMADFGRGFSRWSEVTDRRPLLRFVYGEEEERLGHGRGLLSAIYFYHHSIGIVMEHGLQALVRYAHGWVVAKVDPAAKTKDLTNAQVKAQYLEELTAMRDQGVFVMDKDDELDVIKGGAEGHQQVMGWLDFFRETITQLLLGSLLPSGGGADVGSNARAEVEEGTTETLLDYDRCLLDELYTAQLLGLLWDLNRPQLAMLGLEAARMPELRSGGQKRADPESAVRVIKGALTSNMPVVRKEAYELVGLTQPGDGDDVIAPIEQAAAPAFPGIPG